MGRPELTVSSSVRILPGVGPERAALLDRLGITTIGDLLWHAPRAYEDRRQLAKIGDIQAHGPVVITGKILECGLKRFRQGRKSVFEMVVEDGTGRLHCRWWNMPWLEKNYAAGMPLLVAGRIKELKPLTIDHPDVELLNEDEPVEAGIIAVYPLTEGLTQRWLRALVNRALDAGIAIEEPFPPKLLPERPTHAEALRMLHRPRELHEPNWARERLALEEFAKLQKSMLVRRRNLAANAPRLSCEGDGRIRNSFEKTLPFRLTSAQRRVLSEISGDLKAGLPMRRLLQGDVGSGKTVVAALSAIEVLECGMNAAIMAPTEILAEQHYRAFSAWLGPLGVEVVLRTGSSRMQLSRDAALFTHSAPRTGGVVIGTHALISRDFEIPRLGLVIIDEQHRFGVTQREDLVRKGSYPHLLVMTATPIPRTLGLTVYGDLDSSVLDELPGGRKPIRTYVRKSSALPKVWEFIREHLTKGKQAYVVYPRVSEDEQGELKAVLKEAAQLSKLFTPWRVEALHGRMKPAEKDSVMEGFRANQIQVLVASSLIEVGVDVPNATVMVLENAEQFGLAQLHQLRGRIGRGSRHSYCILVSDADNPEVQERLSIIEKSTDGFEIAEADLQFRGPGDLLGEQQSGLPTFRFGDLRQDLPLVREARRVAAEWLRMG